MNLLRLPLFELLQLPEAESLPNTKALPKTLSREVYLEAVKQDLVRLLNTVQLGCFINFKASPEVAASTLNFGVPSFAGLTMAEDRQQHFRQQLKHILIQFEPRLIPSSITVELTERAHPTDQCDRFAFRIQADVDMLPAPLHLTLASVIDVSNDRLSVTL